MFFCVQSFTGQREDLAQTRERFNEVFKKYTDLEKKKKVKKKQNETQETIVVCRVIDTHISKPVYNGLKHDSYQHILSFYLLSSRI